MNRGTSRIPDAVQLAGLEKPLDDKRGFWVLFLDRASVQLFCCNAGSLQSCSAKRVL